MKKRAVVAVLLMLISFSFAVTSPSPVQGQLGVNILQVNPQQGPAGVPVNLQGTIDTTNGEYQVYLGSKLVASNTSEGFYVNANFTVPELPGGEYSLTLRDVTRRQNSTQTFSISPAYKVDPLVPSAPALMQEGTSVVLNVALTGGQPGTAYTANITVVLPDPLKTEYTQLVTLSVSPETGSANAAITFPSSIFQPSGSVTDFTGSYLVYFNRTQQLGSSQFFVGFTDKSQYHRDQLVAIRAVGYLPNQPATLTISNNDTGTVLLSQSMNASTDGVMTASWAVPSDALIGTYKAAITPEGTPKSIPDMEYFTVPGYLVRFRVLSLANALIPGIAVEALDAVTGRLYNGTSGFGGVATVNLEKGSVNVTAFWNDVKVGELPISVTGDGSFDLTCELTNLKIVVKNEDGLQIPLVNLDITYQYTTTRTGTSRTDKATGMTDISGTFYLNFTLPRIDYRINASLYGIVFNGGNNTFSNVPAVAISEALVVLPSQNLTVTVLDYNFNGIPNARLALAEKTNGIFYAASTNDAGAALTRVSFGVYLVRIYKDNILLNETFVDVFADKTAEIRCVLFNLQVSVEVVDYFGQPIPNANVIFTGPDKTPKTEITQSNGAATFSNVFGGQAQIVAYLSGRENYYEALNLQVASPTAVRITMGKYILLGTFIIETSLFTTIAIVIAVAAALLVVELYRRRKGKQPAKTQWKTEGGK